MSNETAEVARATVDAEGLISKAIDKGISVETMERLLAMRRELKAEVAKESYFMALSLFQAACPPIEKTKKVYDKHGTYRYSYAPLDAIIAQVKDPLKNFGLSYTLDTEQPEDKMTAICSLHHIDGHTETTRITMPIDHSAYMNDTQKVGSALTYAKRYAFCNATGIMTADTDDDANTEGVQISSDGAAMLAKLFVMITDALRDKALTQKEFAAAALGLDDYLAKHPNENVSDYNRNVESKLKKKREAKDVTPDPTQTGSAGFGSATSTVAVTASPPLPSSRIDKPEDAPNTTPDTDDDGGNAQEPSDPDVQAVTVEDERQLDNLF